eukprot:GHVN01002461.1.p1 GENE.GHVN01002461.1~~GHVN01002461.1.p1  ORF type:complete len:769 (+),score=78.30 GHVN01002461.1:2029-4335(+)
MEQNINIVAHVLLKGTALTPHLLTGCAAAFATADIVLQSVHAERGSTLQTELQSLEFRFCCQDSDNSGSSSNSSCLRSLKFDLKAAAQRCGGEATLRRDALLNKSNTLVVMGMNETLLQEETVDVLLREAQLEEMIGSDNPGTAPESLREKLAALRGQPESIIHEAMKRTSITTGAFVVCQALRMCGYKLALMTQGFDWAADVIGKQFGFDYVLRNQLEMQNGQLTGKLSGEPVGWDSADLMDPERKIDWLQLLRDSENINRDNLIVIGDCDTEMWEGSCDYAIYFNSSKHNDMRRVLLQMGFRDRDIRQFTEFILARNETAARCRTLAELATIGFTSTQGWTPPVSPEPQPQQTELFTPFAKADLYVYGSLQVDTMAKLMRSLTTIGDVKITQLQLRALTGISFLGMTIIWPLCVTDSQSPPDYSPLKDIIFEATMSDLKVKIDVANHFEPDVVAHKTEGTSYATVVVQQPYLEPSTLIDVFKAFAEKGLSVLEVSTEGSGFQVIRLQTTVPVGNDINSVKLRLSQIAKGRNVDIAMQEYTFMRYCRRLIVFDMDSTLIQQEVIDELARHVGVEEQVSAVTREAMQGLLDFHDSLNQRVALLKGMDKCVLDRVEESIEFTPGSQQLCGLLHNLGFKLAVISGGFTQFARFVKNRLRLHHAFANQLEFDENGVATGRITGVVVTPQRKASLLRMLAQIYRCTPEQVIAVGDGANDIPMLMEAGMAVAFCAKPKVQERAEFRLNNRDLMPLIYLMGLTGLSQTRQWSYN